MTMSALTPETRMTMELAVPNDQYARARQSSRIFSMKYPVWDRALPVEQIYLIVAHELLMYCSTVCLPVVLGTLQG